MRLTLRTLLAYRDGVLSPAVTSDLHQRINQTEVASNLLRRIETLVQQKQMLAPKAIGTGLGGDANSVAEYLDDTLASDQVSEFERICIAESDLVLAELAHCHQLLADALNSTVHVPAELKTLVNGLAKPENQAALSSRIRPVRTSTLPAKMSRSGKSPDGKTHRVDESHAASLVTAVEVNSNEVANKATVPQATELVTSAANLETKDNAGLSSQVKAPLDVIGAAPSKPTAGASTLSKPTHQVPDYLVAQNKGGWRIPAAILIALILFVGLAFQALGPLTKIQGLFVANGEALPTEKSPPESPNGNPSATEPSTETVADKAKRDNAAAVDSSKAAQPKVDAAVAESSGTKGSVESPEQVVAPEKSEPIANVKDVANGNSSSTEVADVVKQAITWNPSSAIESRSVLFLKNSGGGELQSVSRLGPSTAIPLNSELIVPPSMRPTLTLAETCSLTVCAPSIMLPAINDAGELSIETSLCRALVKSDAAGRSTSFLTPAGAVDIQFVEPASMVSIESAFRDAALGPVTNRMAFKPLFIVVAVEGKVAVRVRAENPERSDQKSIELNVGEGLALIDGQVTEFELGTIPTWYRSNIERPVDALAAEDMSSALNDGGDLQAKLKAMCMDRRPETSALAIQASLMLGAWSGFANNLLSDETMRTHWESSIALAEQVLAVDETAVKKLSVELEQTYGESSSKLLGILLGANMTDSSDETHEVTLQKLVEALSSDQLETRVLAVHRLRKLTGKDLGFQPSNPNRAAMQLWRREVVSNKTPFNPFSSILWEAKPTERDNQ